MYVYINSREIIFRAIGYIRYTSINKPYMAVAAPVIYLHMISMPRCPIIKGWRLCDIYSYLKLVLVRESSRMNSHTFSIKYTISQISLRIQKIFRMEILSSRQHANMNKLVRPGSANDRRRREIAVLRRSIFPF